MNVGCNIVTGAWYLIAVWLVGFDTAVRARHLAYARHAFVSILGILSSLTRQASSSPATT